MADEKLYYFIDCAYARSIYRRAMEEVFAGSVAPEPDPAKILFCCGGQRFRTYVYDCIDEQRAENESDSDRQKRVEHLEGYFEKFRAHRGVHVRLGTVKGRKQKARQKEVDILLAVDMLTHGFNRNMTHAILLAGDLDFRPVVDALIRSGVFVEVMYEKRSTAQELYGAADYGIPLNWETLYSWSPDAFAETHELPTRLTNAPVGSQQVRIGRTQHGDTVRLLLWQQRYFLHAPHIGENFHLSHNNHDVLEKYYSVCFERQIGWRQA